MKIIFPLGLILALVAGGAIGWFSAMKKAGGSATSMASTGNDPSHEALFQLDGKIYTLADVPADTRNALLEGQAAAFDRNQATIKEFALRLSLAKAKDATVAMDKLPPLQDLLTATPPTDAEMTKFFEENKARLPPNVTFEQIKGQLAQFMTRQKSMEGMQTQLTQMETEGRLKILLPEPVSPPVNLELAGYPSRGPENAKTVLVEASDYLCPHCRDVQPEVEELLKGMNDKFRFVQVTYALRPEGLSGSLARGSYCAQKQGSDIFWKYHAGAFKVNPEEAAKNDKARDKEVTVAVAKEAGAKEPDFTTCLASPEAQAFVQSTLTKMSQAGVSGTPTFFLNNRKIQSHGQPLKTLVNGAMAGG